MKFLASIDALCRFEKLGVQQPSEHTPPNVCPCPSNLQKNQGTEHNESHCHLVLQQAEAHSTLVKQKCSKQASGLGKFVNLGGPSWKEKSGRWV